MDAEDSKIKGYQDGSFDAVMSASYTAESYASEGKDHSTSHCISYISLPDSPIWAILFCGK